MEIFDVHAIKAFSEKEKNVFYKTNEFKMRIIELDLNQELPDCEMKSYVIFFLIVGAVEVTVNSVKNILNEGQCLVSEPALFSMKAIENSRLVGIQINKQNN